MPHFTSFIYFSISTNSRVYLFVSVYLLPAKYIRNNRNRCQNRILYYFYHAPQKKTLKQYKSHKQIIKNHISRAWKFLYCLYYIRKFHDIPFPFCVFIFIELCVLFPFPVYRLKKFPSSYRLKTPMLSFSKSSIIDFDISDFSGTISAILLSSKLSRRIFRAVIVFRYRALRWIYIQIQCVRFQVGSRKQAHFWCSFFYILNLTSWKCLRLPRWMKLTAPSFLYIWTPARDSLGTRE